MGRPTNKGQKNHKLKPGTHCFRVHIFELLTALGCVSVISLGIHGCVRHLQYIRAHENSWRIEGN